ncbi:receptor-like protein 12 isoform X3 [Arachis ipaensis]|uniref:receptor-like protein 12 isoform X3 n=1 Tax=Arachis ipaensis TaxID=130454 RepID=UPI000A2B7BDF|nr:receptor-like protein 12 isoform X3 [Arachis ipaensis]
MRHTLIHKYSFLNIMMRCYILLLLLLLLHNPSSSCSSVLPLCNHHDNSNLLQFKNSFSINTSLYKGWPGLSSCYNKIASWKNGTDCCEWDGVTCDTTSGHVIGLDLSCSMLQGEFRPNSTLFQLTHLQQLNLAANDFSDSPIHPGIGDLVSLTHLNLSCSSFGNHIPSTISRLSKLLSLDFSYNDELTLDESTWSKLIGNTTNLNELLLDYVDMSSLRETSLSLLMNFSSSLLSLTLSDTGLHGKFPTGVLGFPNLEELSLLLNEELKGELPKSNWSTPLTILDLSYTVFSGEIPDSIGHLKSLNQLRLQFCRFDGLIPVSLWNLTQLTDLDLSGNRLHGEIPSLLSNLKHLTYLALSDNTFSGHIPDVFDNFTKLDTLLLSFNSLGGQVPPSLFRLTQLSVLDLSYNSLEGPIPGKDTKLSKIKYLFLGNNLLNGTIPNWCYSSPSLTNLDLGHNNLVGLIGEFSTYSLNSLVLSNNKFQGSFPNSIFKLKNLNTLDLSSVNLSGHVDFRQLSKLKSLLSLDLSHNNFLSINLDDNVDYFLPNLTRFRLSSCKITKFPRFLGSIQDLKVLDLSDNQIEGVIPKWFNDKLLYKWKNMEFIDLSFNRLQGNIPIPSYGTYYFSVSKNNFTGGISSTICNASSLNMLILSHNNLNGKIPQCLGTIPLLQVLDLQINNFYGSIPGNFSKKNAFETIKLNGNQLEGPIPQSLAHCTNLEVLDLSDNNIQDVFPSRLEALQELQVLSLRNNKFYGTITCLSMKHPFPKLRIFDVSNNKFSGPLPMQYFQEFQGMMARNDNTQTGGLEYMSTVANTTSVPYNDSVVIIMKGEMIEMSRILTIFTTIDLSNNLFEGKIPQILGELNSLKGLNLSHNKISGIIPQTLGNLTSLEWLDLSRNQLKGEIPMALINLNFLSVLNLSKNQLEGMIPTGKQFNTFQNDSYKNNPMLCGFPLSKSCGNDEEQPPSVFTEATESLFGWKSVTVGYGCGVVFGMFLGKLFIKTAKPLWLARLLCRYT